MVGVPRSKGCRMCVQRRIKCDQTRPICNRCLKRGLECPGYDTSVKFQDEGEKLRQRYAKKAKRDDACFAIEEPDLSISSTPSSQSETFSRLGPQTSSGSSMVIRRLPHGQNQGHSESCHEYTAHSPAATIVYSPEIFQTQLLGMFIGAISPQEPNVPQRYRQGVNWLKFLAEQPAAQMSSALSSSIRALTLSHLGRMQSSDHLLETSRIHYGQALTQLANIFRRSPDIEGMSSTTLSATMLLSYYEMFHSTKTNGWVRHAGGVSALIRARGPALAVASTFDRLMFMAYRHALVIHAFEANTECFLTEPAWADTVKQIEEEIADGTAFNALAAAMMEEMAKFPGAIAKARDLPSVAEQAMFPAAAKLRDELKLRIIKHRETYKRLYAQITIDLKSRNQNPRTKAAADPNEILFPNQFEFDNMSVASIHSGYWTCLTMLNVTLIEILRAEVLAKTTAQKTSTTNHADPDMTDFSGSKAYPSPPRPLSQNQMERQLDEKQLETDEQCVLDPSTLRLENIQNATNSCKAVDYMSTSQFQGPFLITFALRVSLLAFPGERERAWVRDQLRKLGRKFGMAGDIEDEDALRRVYEDILSQKQLAGSETPLSDI